MSTLHFLMVYFSSVHKSTLAVNQVIWALLPKKYDMPIKANWNKRIFAPLRYRCITRQGKLLLCSALKAAEPCSHKLFLVKHRPRNKDKLVLLSPRSLRTDIANTQHDIRGHKTKKTRVRSSFIQWFYTVRNKYPFFIQWAIKNPHSNLSFFQ